MKREPIKLPDHGAKHGTLASHRWLAGNTAVPFYYGFDEQLQKTIEFLQERQLPECRYLRAEDWATATNSSRRWVSTPLHLKPAQTVEAYVVIQNKNIGHSLIPEVRDLYEAWVQFTVKDASGAARFTTAASSSRMARSNPERTASPIAPSTSIGDFVDNHKVWTIHSVAYDNTIQAGRSALVRYQFQLPKDVKGPITITAAVNYRHLRQSYLNNIFGPDHPAYPVVELASRTRTLEYRRQSRRARAAHRQSRIGCAGTISASPILTNCSTTTRCTPSSRWSGCGRTTRTATSTSASLISSGRNTPKPVRRWRKRWPSSPNDARALYYLALVERRQRHSEAEIADLQKVIAQYPNHAMPGANWASPYYQQHRAAEAMAAVQGAAADRS